MAGSGHFLSFFGGLFVTVLYSPKEERVLAELHRDSSYVTMGKGGWVKAWETRASPTAPPPATRILPFLEWWSSARSLGKSGMIESPLIREDRRGGEAQGHSEVPDPFRPRAARAGSPGEIDLRRVSPGRRRGVVDIVPRPRTLPGGDAGDSQAPGALGPG